MKTNAELRAWCAEKSAELQRLSPYDIILAWAEFENRDESTPAAETKGKCETCGGTREKCFEFEGETWCSPCPECSTARAPAADVPSMRCPKCGESMPDHDGFGVLHHEKCGYCTHASRINGVCELCGDGARAPAAEPIPYCAAHGVWPCMACGTKHSADCECPYCVAPKAQPAAEREGK